MTLSVFQMLNLCIQVALVLIRSVISFGLQLQLFQYLQMVIQEYKLIAPVNTNQVCVKM